MIMLLTDWAESETCPWTLGTAREYARKALSGRPGYRHLPFLQTCKGSPIRVDVPKMEAVIFRRKGGKK